MAVFLITRLIIAAGAGHRVVKAEQSATGQPSYETAIRWAWDRLRDEDEDDVALSEALEGFTGYAWSVATFSAPFVLRRLQVQWQIQSAVGVPEDVRVCTFHLAKVSGGAVVDTWDAADFTAARNAFLTFWGESKGNYPAHFILTRTAFYRAGPGVEPPQPPVNSADHNVPGTNVSTFALPPQVALTVTEKHGGLQRNWGRWFLPVVGVGMTNAYGRGLSTALDTLADDLDVMYQAWLSASLPAVVYLEELPERSPTATDPRYRTKGTYPARPATARTVDQLQLDDLFDVMRSRRYDRPQLRVLRDVG